MSRSDDDRLNSTPVKPKDGGASAANDRSTETGSARAHRIAVLGVILTTLALAGLVLAVRQPWQHRTKVLSARVPQCPYQVELWEKPYWRLGLGYEYETWFVVRSPEEGEAWHLIDAQYITFRDVALFVSSDRGRVRVETSGQAAETHMIGEYDFRRKQFKAESEPTVRGKPGWELLSAAHIR